ncbi:MAG: death domain-containing protein, partial [Proteobacteria bacterium]|nr:death domain-containing protein [Pseudomonadota bacterium]
PEAKHWHNIGSLLEISETTLEQIEADYPGDCQQCVREMIKSWLKQVDPPPSWKDLAEAIQIINPYLAKKISNYGTVDTIME